MSSSTTNAAAAKPAATADAGKIRLGGGYRLPGYSA